MDVRRLVFITASFCFLLLGCASSNVSRDAATNVDVGVQNARNFANGAGGDIADLYQNTSQSTKGAVIGGATGALAGAMYSPLGLITGLATGAILGASYGAYIDVNTSSADRLENRGVNIVNLGDYVLIVLSSSRLFEPMTSTVKLQAYSTLKMVTQYINQHTKTLVKVAAYTNDNGTGDVDTALSQQQAHNVAKVLTELGVNARLLYASGYGGSHLVDSTALGWDQSLNYRVEITYKKLYV